MAKMDCVARHLPPGHSLFSQSLLTLPLLSRCSSRPFKSAVHSNHVPARLSNFALTSCPQFPAHLFCESKQTCASPHYNCLSTAIFSIAIMLCYYFVGS